MSLLTQKDSGDQEDHHFEQISVCVLYCLSFLSLFSVLYPRSLSVTTLLAVSPRSSYRVRGKFAQLSLSNGPNAGSGCMGRVDQIVSAESKDTVALVLLSYMGTRI